MNLKIVLVLTFLSSTLAGREIELESFTPSPETDKTLIDYGTIRVTKKSRNNYVISGSFELKKNLGNEKSIVFELLSPKGDAVFKNKLPICDYFKSDQKIWAEIVKASDMPQNNPCPFPKGNYTITGYTVDEAKFRGFPPGKYHARGKLVDSGDAKKIFTAVDVIAELKAN